MSKSPTASENEATKIENVADNLEQADDMGFLAQGGIARLDTCPIARWHLNYFTHYIDGNAYCCWCKAVPPNGCIECELSSGDTLGCLLASKCECATAWSKRDYWPQARLDGFRKWVNRQLRTEAKAIRDRQTMARGAVKAGTTFADAVAAGIAEGRAHRSKYFDPV